MHENIKQIANVMAGLFEFCQPEITRGPAIHKWVETYLDTGKIEWNV